MSQGQGACLCVWVVGWRCRKGGAVNPRGGAGGARYADPLHAQVFSGRARDGAGRAGPVRTGLCTLHSTALSSAGPLQCRRRPDRPRWPSTRICCRNATALCRQAGRRWNADPVVAGRSGPAAAPSGRLQGRTSDQGRRQGASEGGWTDDMKYQRTIFRRDMMSNSDSAFAC